MKTTVINVKTKKPLKCSLKYSRETEIEILGKNKLKQTTIQQGNKTHVHTHTCTHTILHMRTHKYAHTYTKEYIQIHKHTHTPLQALLTYKHIHLITYEYKYFFI